MEKQKIIGNRFQCHLNGYRGYFGNAWYETLIWYIIRLFYYSWSCTTIPIENFIKTWNIACLVINIVEHPLSSLAESERRFHFIWIRISNFPSSGLVFGRPEGFQYNRRGQRHAVANLNTVLKNPSYSKVQKINEIHTDSQKTSLRVINSHMDMKHSNATNKCLQWPLSIRAWNYLYS